MNHFSDLISQYDIASWNQRTLNIALNVDYYVYKHYLDGKLFYIGKGKGERCFEFKNRGSAWDNYVDGRENEVLVDIVKTFTCENEAFNYESNEIILCESDCLVNVKHNNPELKRKLKKENAICEAKFKRPTNIVYGNAFNEVDFSNLTSVDLDILMALLSQINKKSLKDGKLEIKISFNNLRKLINNKHMQAIKIKESLKKFDEELNLLSYMFLSRSVVKVKFLKDITEKILSNEKGYTVFNFNEYIALSNKNSKKLYMKLSESRMKGEFVIEKYYLLELFNPPSSYDENYFLRRIMDKALEENQAFFPNLAFSNLVGNELPEVCKFSFFKKRTTKLEKEIVQACSDNILELMEKYRI